MAKFEETLLLGDFLDQRVLDHPDRAVFYSRGSETTYKQLSDQVDICARAMLASGLKKGDGVAVLSSQRMEVFITFFAAAKIGLLWMGINPKYQLREMSHVVADAKPKMIIGIQELDGRDYADELTSIRKNFPFVEQFIGFDGGGSYDESLEQWMSGPLSSEEELKSAINGINSDIDSMLIYTSGSSGTPKGVLLPQKAILKRAMYEWNVFYLEDDYPRGMCPLPITHVGGIIVLPLYAMVGGGNMILMETFDLNDYVQNIINDKVNMLGAVPAMHMLMFKHPQFSLKLLNEKIKWILWSGAKMPDEAVKIFFSTDCMVGSTYGTTESCASVTYAIKQSSSLEVLTNTIGKGMPNGEVRIANDDKICAANEEGEIQVKPDYSMSGYLNNKEATDAAFTSDGWYRTGDIGAMREDGNFTFTSRMSEMYVSGGYNVYPLEIEQTLESFEKVSLVAVIDVEDEIYGHVGWAYIMPKPGMEISEEEINEFVRGQLANYKVPRKYFIEPMLPMLPIGKIDKISLKKRVEDEGYQ